MLARAASEGSSDRAQADITEAADIAAGAARAAPAGTDAWGQSLATHATALSTKWNLGHDRSDANVAIARWREVLDSPTVSTLIRIAAARDAA
ncbi:hypothetical protein ACIBL3_41040 [Kribbella sp. NPDC050124]|uniref:hypothetical protein n=1 Tax=Kribbella sp. NPDC050124 TaxID=3364114 RepID=UPI0037B58613